MTTDEWDAFFDLVEKILQEDGTWQNKCEELVQQADNRGRIDDIKELVSWFGL